MIIIVIKATDRVTGKDSFDQNPIQSTVGATRKTGFMDRSIDYVMSLFGKDPTHKREKKRTEILTQRAINEPIIAQKPIAPLQRIDGDTPATNLEINMIILAKLPSSIIERLISFIPKETS